MIVGIGTDLAQHQRVAAVWARHPLRFPAKVLSATELEIFQRHTPTAAYLAKRWAAKEALGKAVGCGIRAPLLLPTISVLNDDLGRPFFVLTPTVEQWLRARGIARIHLSLSDDAGLSLAFVVLESA